MSRFDPLPLVALVPRRGMLFTGVRSVALVPFHEAVGGEEMRGVAVEVVLVAPFGEGPLVPGPLDAWTARPRAALDPAVAPLRAGCAGCEVGLSGHAVLAEGGRETFSIELGKESVRLAIAASAPGRIPLAAPYLSTLEGTPLDTALAPLDLERGGKEEVTRGAETPRARAECVVAPPEPGDELCILGLESVDLETSLGFGVRVRLDFRDGTWAMQGARCEAVEIDVDARQVRFTHRMALTDRAGARGLDRIVVGVLPPDAADDDTWWHELPRASFGRVILAGRGLTPPERLTADELARARYEAWDVDGAPEPLLPFEESIEIVRALGRGEPRAEVLEAHGLEEYEWQVEEWALAHALAAPPEVGEAELLGEEGADVPADAPAREALVRGGGGAQVSGAPKLEAVAFARLAARIEVGDVKALGEAGLDVAGFLAEAERWAVATEQDATLAEALDEATTAARAEAEADVKRRIEGA